jgi:hypothetical protein
VRGDELVRGLSPLAARLPDDLLDLSSRLFPGFLNTIFII